MLPPAGVVLRHLTIENLALVDRIDIDVGPGLNVLTGETGAGKSVLVSALSLVLGARASSEAIRAGAKEGVVEALFELTPELRRRLESRGIDTRDGELVVRRTVSRQGKSRVLMNGQMATVSMLAECLRGAVDITSQHEHVRLLDEQTHLFVVDAFGDLGRMRSAVERAHTEVLGYRTALSNLGSDEAEKARREDYLRYALDEIQSIDPSPGELEELEAERSRLKNATELAEGVRQAEGSLYSEDGAVIDVVGRVQRELIRLSGLDERLGALSGAAASVLAELEDLSRELGKYGGSLTADPERLERIEDRIDQIKRLTRKHGGSVEAVLEAREAMARELDELENDEVRRADLTAALEAAEEERGRLARELSAARHRVVRALEKAISAELADLSMERTRVAVELVPLPEPNGNGAESAEIRISPNAGEPLRPLKKTASGGELSRVLLAIKHVLAHKSEVSTYVFDEVDSGIGGAVAEVVGAKLKGVSETSQILCVTHLPQVASFAEQHLRVQKRERAGRTLTEVVALDERDRVEELARMLGGVEITDKTRSLAAEMRHRGSKGGNGRAAPRT